MTRLTCITTTYNDGPALLTSVRSVLAQGFRDFEYIIVDDGSADDTPALLATLDDPRIRVIRQANDGLSGARNKALEQARGDYVCFLDADDSRPNWAFAAMAAVIDRDAPDLILCRGILSDVRGDLGPFYDSARFAQVAALCPAGLATRDSPGAAAIWPLAQRMEPQSANKAVRRDLLTRTGIGFPDTHFFEDIYFHTSVLAAAERVSFLHTPCFTYFRRYLRPQITSTAGDLRFDIIAVTRLTLEGFARRPQFHDPAYRAAVLASCLKIMEWCGASIGHAHRGAFRQTARAMLRMIDPLYLHLPPPGTDDDLAPLHRYLEGLTHAD
ncbi:glycosyltransferase family 2 protein [Paracoccaceae bacterium Fryx2]|nr:glycosyltransferase family 2 protein [Paracoccaceae bacterium Fryx2]